MKKELMKRVAAAGLAVSMVAGLTACGPTGKPEETKKEETKAEGGETSAAADKEDAAASDGEVTLRFSWWGGDARHKATEAACQAFMEKYPNIKVECEYGAWDGTTNARTIIWHQFCFLLFFKLLKVLLDTELDVS